MHSEHAISGQPVLGLWLPGNESRQWWGGHQRMGWGHLCHLETSTECPLSPAPVLIPGFLPILGLLSGGQVGHWASKLSLLAHLFPQAFQEVEEGGDNQPSF